MRTIMNISLPAQLAAKVDGAVREHKFASRSEFVRKLIRDWSERRAVREVLKGHKDYKKGRYIVLDSLADLD